MVHLRCMSVTLIWPQHRLGACRLLDRAFCPSACRLATTGMLQSKQPWWSVASASPLTKLLFVGRWCLRTCLWALLVLLAGCGCGLGAMGAVGVFAVSVAPPAPPTLSLFYTD